jgi:hypothetical protein
MLLSCLAFTLVTLLIGYVHHLVKYPAGTSAGGNGVSNIMHDQVNCKYVPSVMQCTVDLG